MKMRLLAFAAAALWLAPSIASSEDAQPPSRQPTHIAAQPLGPALEELAASRGLQVLYLSALVRDLQTPGASGDLTADEAFELLLRGTGLIHRRLDAKTVSVFSQAPDPKAAPPAESSPTPHRRPDEAAAPEVTIRGDREAIEQRARAFVKDVIKAPSDASLARWNIPVCPTVAGMPKTATAFVIARIKAIAKAAGAPVASENCRGNLVVIVASESQAALRRWYANDDSIFGTATTQAIDAFLNAAQPVRVWYNVRAGHSNGLPYTTDCPPTQGGAIAAATLNGYDNCTADDTRLAFNAVRTMTSVIVAVDTSHIAGTQLGQLTDYVALTGLAEIRPDATAAGAPSILRLFSSPPAQRAAGLTTWDAALLKALYHARLNSKTQRSQIEQSIVKDIAP